MLLFFWDNYLSYYRTYCDFFFFKLKTAYEMRIRDWSSDVCSSDLKYAEKALALSSGEHVQPEMIAARDLPSDKVDELSDARVRLMTAMSAGAAEEKPLDAAMAQANFDCWMEQQEENFQPDDIAACRDGFEVAMAELEEEPEVAVAPPAPEPMMAAPAAYIVHFEFDEAALTPDARTTLADVAKRSEEHTSELQSLMRSSYAV